jgi:FkbM family methyltransferase
MNMSAMNDFSYERERAIYIERASALQRDRWADMPNWVRDDPKSSLVGKRLIICGSQMTGEILFTKSRGEVVAIVDDFLCQRQDTHLGIPVITTDEWIVRARSDDSIVSLVYSGTVPGYNHFMRCVVQHQIPYLNVLDAFRVIACDESHVPGSGQTFVYGLPFYLHAVSHLEAHLKCAEVFEDDFSRFTFFCMLNYRLDCNPYRLQLCSVGMHHDRFSFNSYALNRSFFDLATDEVYVDGGAFDGDSLEHFVHATQGRFKKIYCFEPTVESALKCHERLAGLQRTYGADIVEKVSIIERGLWDCATTLEFKPTLYSGSDSVLSGPMPQSAHIIDSGLGQYMYRPEEETRDNAIRIRTVSLDDICDEPVSLIKLEIEGSELKALEGASKTIRRDRPKMALSVYHKPEDMLEITDFVMNTGLKYKMSLRQHDSLLPGATVCYCY